MGAVTIADSAAPNPRTHFRFEAARSSSHLIRSSTEKAGLDLGQLEAAFRSGVKTFLFSNPSNPTGVVYAPSKIEAIARLAKGHGVTVIVDQLYARLLFPGRIYTHLCAAGIDPQRVVTIM